MKREQPLPGGRRKPLSVHRLPEAPVFMGRTGELEQLQEFWNGDGAVISLVGLGGAGKTAVLQKFLTEVEASDTADGILVWSFYDDPDSNAFLRTAVNYFSDEAAVEAAGTGWFQALRKALE